MENVTGLEGASQVIVSGSDEINNRAEGPMQYLNFAFALLCSVEASVPSPLGTGRRINRIRYYDTLLRMELRRRQDHDPT